MLEALTQPSLVPAAVLEVERLRRGDVRAFETLYRTHCGPLFGLALRLTGRPADAEELTQEVFVRAWEHRSDFDNPDHFRRWLRKVTVNLWLSDVRRRKPLALDDEDGGGADQLVDPRSRNAAATPAQRLDLERAIAALPTRMRAVFVLFDVYGYRHEEVGDLLELTAGSSKVLLHRARRRLKELMG